MSGDPEILDLLVVGAGPTGIAIGAEARQAGLSVLLVDRGPLTAAIQAYPTFLEFFTTRERLEIAGIPFAIPESKPTRRQALVYYRSVVERFGIPLALHEDVLEVTRDGRLAQAGFAVRTRLLADPPLERVRSARAVALATGYFDGIQRLGVPGEERPWVHHRYVEPYRHFGEDVVIVGAGNTAVEAALDLWRNGARVTLVHRGPHVKRGVKYWLKPDIENRIAEGSIPSRFGARVRAFREEGAVEIEIAPSPMTSGGLPAPAATARIELLPAQAAFVLIGYLPDADFQRRCGIAVEPVTLVPTFDPASCETNVPGLYVAGTIQAGREIDRIFIENSRDHAPRIVGHLARRLRRAADGAASGPAAVEVASALRS